ncbi:MAG: FtsX-like permease family protein [Bariatricus sp.]|nr:FtsX-like permease family protein [Bariatricus sp.]
MKKNILRKDFFMEIRKSRGRFISIFFIVALGVAFYSGIRSSQPSMLISGDAYFDRENLMDINVMGTMGLTDEDIQAIASVDGIEEVEGSYSKDVLCPTGDNEKVVHIMAAQERFNTVNVVEGRMPEKEGECLLDEDFLSYGDFEIGDEITFRSGDDSDLSEYLTGDTYKIVGIGNSPLYISFGRGNSLIGNGEVSGFVIVDKSSFDMDAYTEAYVRVEGAADAVAFTDEYDELSDAAKAAIEEIEEERCAARRDEVLAEANAGILDAQKEVDENFAELEQAKKELDDAKSIAAKKLEDARKELEEGETLLEESRKQIEEGQKQIEDAKSELNRQQETLNDAKTKYESGYAEFSKQEQEFKEGEAEYQKNYEQYMPLITSGKEEIENGKAQIADGRKQIEEGIAQIDTGIEQLQQASDGLEQIDTAITALDKVLQIGEKLYDKIAEIPEEERTVFQQKIADTYLSLLEQKEALEMQRTDILEKLQESGIESADQIPAKIEELQTQREELVQKQAELDQTEKELLEKETGLLAMEQQLIEAGNEIESGRIQLNAVRSELASAKAQIADGEKQINAAWAIIREKEESLNEGKLHIASSQKQLDDGEFEYAKSAADAVKQFEEGEAKIRDGEEKLTEARQQIADAKAEIAKVEEPTWYIQDRSEAMVEYDGYGENADRMRSIGEIFPFLFFLVAALISLTTMTRMVEEQRVQIGTMKALGYDKSAIAGKYIFYALVATLGGSIIGVLIGEKIFPLVIIYAYKILYTHIPDILLPYHMSYAIKATGIAVIFTLAATIGSCYKELAANPASLMRPPAPKQGKRILLERIGWFWKRLGFTWKSSIRNLIRYKKRFFMTIFGIGGCMALLLVGFGLKDCIYEIVDLQYEKIQFYDATAYMNEDTDKEERNQIIETLEKDSKLEEFTQVRMQKLKVKSESDESSLYLVVPSSEEELKSFLSFHSRTKKDETYTLTDDKVILTEKMSQILDVGVGDTIIIKDEDKGDKEVTIGAICENYMGHYLYLSSETYEELYGAAPKYNSFFLRMKDGSEDAAEDTGKKLLEFDDVLNVSYSKSIESRLDDMLKSLNLVIVVLIVSAGMLAFVVLYNLNNINITERRRELATLKVLGFYDMEVASYVYRENVMLTFLGAFVGMGLGNLMHRFVIVTVEVNEAMFGRSIHPISYLYSLLFTVAFSMFVNWVMFYKLKKIDMVESLKSVE